MLITCTICRKETPKSITAFNDAFSDICQKCYNFAIEDSGRSEDSFAMIGGPNICRDCGCIVDDCGYCDCDSDD